MCGFFGQFNTRNLPESDFNSLLAMAKHRGPDDTGYFEGENVQLGFNRLSIIDLSSAGHQPMTSTSGRFTIVFNGEIYNHKELRKKLPEHKYRSHCDTETIVHALEVWGVRKTVESLDGMFALAIYEEATKELSLVRDFAGIKPLFYGKKNGQIVFGSQYDQVKAHPLFRENEINPQVLKLYLKQHFLPPPFGLHSELHQLLPGEIITFSSNGDQKKYRFWELPEVRATDLVSDESKAQELFSEFFSECIDDQLVADVPVGAFLSGGIDSPLVCAYAKQKNENINVFTIGSDSKKHDESDRAAKIAEALQLKHHTWRLDASEMLSFWDEAAEALHEPLADYSILPTYLVSKLAKREVSVALSGDGGDELFMGYERFWSVSKNITMQDYALPVRKLVYGIDKLFSNNKNFNSLLTLKDQATAHESLHNRFLESWITDMAPDLQNVSVPDQWQVYNYENTNSISQLMANMRKAEFYGMLQKTLRKVDSASMQNSLEVRVPFLQKKNIEVALQIDPLLNIHAGARKQVLKNNLFSKVSHISDDGLKKGFSIPLSQWLKGVLFEKVMDELSSNSNKLYFTSTEKLKEMMIDHKNEIEDLTWPIFTMYSLAKNL